MTTRDDIRRWLERGLADPDKPTLLAKLRVAGK